MDERPDAEVVASVLAGDAEEYGVLLGRYRDAYTRYAVRMLGNPDDADDALQSAFVRGFRYLGKCKTPERFGAWLYQIVVNECRTACTRRGRREKWVMAREDADSQLQRESMEPAASDVVMRSEIQRALDRLPSDQREAFLLKHVEELSYEEIAGITGVGVSALKMRVKRACDQLREHLEGEK